MAGFIVRVTTAEDWRAVRGLRLEMLRDTPLAYLETLQDALARDEAEWRRRGARGTSATSTFLAAIADDGTWVGTMGAVLPANGAAPILVGVYVTPRWRGSALGVTDELLSAVEEWAARHGKRLTLSVHEANPRARAAYERRGFTLTGRTEPYPLAAGGLELEMAKSLG